MQFLHIVKRTNVEQVLDTKKCSSFVLVDILKTIDLDFKKNINLIFVKLINDI
jgi:hypothetical protein